MLHKVEDQIAYLSKYVGLNEGDMILTGTGAGVSVIKAGDMIETRLLQGDDEVVLSMQTPVVGKWEINFKIWQTK